jgi:hypothetical protein
MRAWSALDCDGDLIILAIYGAASLSMKKNSEIIYVSILSEFDY